MSRTWLAVTLARRTVKTDRTTTRLAIVLIALVQAELTLMAVWRDAPLAFGMWILSVVLVTWAVAMTAPARNLMLQRLFQDGASQLTCGGVAASHALAVATPGVVLGTTIGLALRIPLDRYIPSFTAAADVISGAALGAAGSLLVVSTWTSIGAIWRTVNPGVRVRRTRYVMIRLVASVLALALAVWFVAADATSFGNLQTDLAVVAPVIGLATAGLAAAALVPVSRLLRRRGGTWWFALRADQGGSPRTTPVMSVVAIVVGALAVGAMLTSSLYQRRVEAEEAWTGDPHPAWALPTAEPGFLAPPSDPAEREALAQEWRRLAAESGDPRMIEMVESMLSAPGPPPKTPRVLNDTHLAFQDPGANWLLVGVALGLALPLVGIAAAVNRAARRDEDELLALQGAPGSLQRRASTAEALVLSGLGSAVGVVVAVAGTTAAMALYNGSTRFNVSVVYPEVPIVLPVGVLAALVLAVPAFATVVAWCTTTPPRRARTDLARRVDQPVAFA